MKKPWFQILGPVENLIQWEALILLWLFVLFTYVFYRTLLKKLSEERHRKLKERFANLSKQLFTLTLLFALFSILDSFKEVPLILRFVPYIGLMTIFFGALSFIQSCRILLLQYLFLASVRTAVPLLLVNIFTLVITLFVGGWLVTTLFGIQVAPLLATSAAFSLILGLALQDTLGNLFAGIAMQLDHTFEIGDWIEIVQGTQKITGQVSEITWRSTVMIGMMDELINLPNRFVAQSQINNWSRPETPIARSQNFRVPYNQNLDRIVELLTEALHRVPNIRKNPRPLAFASEPAESWVTIKAIYYLDDYGRYASAADAVIRECVRTLNEQGIPLAYPKLDINASKEWTADSNPKLLS